MSAIFCLEKRSRFFTILPHRAVSSAISESSFWISIVNRSFQLFHHHLQMNNIIPVLELGEEPVTVTCDSQQIEQALLALEMNAVEAMPEGGTLKLRLGEGPAGRLFAHDGVR